MTLKRILTGFGVLLLLATSAFADIAYIGQEPADQAWNGPLGLAFDVNTPITITYMGVYNGNAPTIPQLVSELQVAIYQTTGTQNPGPNQGPGQEAVTTTGTQVAGTVVTFNAGTSYTQLPGDSYDLFQAITPVTLAPGAYEVVATGFTSGQPNGNDGNGGPGSIEGITDGSITYVEYPSYGTNGPSLYYPNVVDTYPASNYPNGGPPNRYDAGTFAIAPDGGTTLPLLGLAVGGLAGLRRKLSV